MVGIGGWGHNCPDWRPWRLFISLPSLFVVCSLFATTTTDGPLGRGIPPTNTFIQEGWKERRNWKKEKIALCSFPFFFFGSFSPSPLSVSFKYLSPLLHTEAGTWFKRRNVGACVEKIHDTVALESMCTSRTLEGKKKSNPATNWGSLVRFASMRTTAGTNGYGGHCSISGLMRETAERRWKARLKTKEGRTEREKLTTMEEQRCPFLSPSTFFFSAYPLLAWILSRRGIPRGSKKPNKKHEDGKKK